MILRAVNLYTDMNSLLLLFLLVAAHVNGECPALEDIPDMYSSNTFLCARFYYGFGHDLGVRGCNGCSLADHADLPHGRDEDAGDGYHYPMGSVMVKAGCTLYVFHENNYGGSYDRYDGPTIISRIDSGHNSVDGGCAKGHPSFQCRCGMKPVSCTPDDKFEVILRCDATGAISPVGCNYIKKLGIVFDDELSNSASISTTLKYEITESFLGLFESKLGVSMTTGYDWSQTSSVSSSTLQEFEVIAEAPPGLILTIEQAVGTCGDSEARTELFRIRHTDAKGNILMTSYEKTIL